MTGIKEPVTARLGNPAAIRLFQPLNKAVGETSHEIRLPHAPPNGYKHLQSLMQTLICIHEATVRFDRLIEHGALFTKQLLALTAAPRSSNSCSFVSGF